MKHILLLCTSYGYQYMQFRHHPEGDFGIGHGFQTISMNSWMGYSTVNTTYISDTGKSYDFNTATKKQ